MCNFVSASSGRCHYQNINWFVDIKLWETTSILSTREYSVTSDFVFQNNSKFKINFYVQDGCQYGCLVLIQLVFSAKKHYAFVLQQTYEVLVNPLFYFRILCKVVKFIWCHITVYIILMSCLGDWTWNKWPRGFPISNQKYGSTFSAMLCTEVYPYSYTWWCEYSQGPLVSFVTTDEFSVRITKITLRICVICINCINLCQLSKS